MSILTPHDCVVIARDTLQSADPYDIVRSNVDFVNALFVEHLGADEVSRDALRSYYVDYFHAQWENGGFSQFVYNSQWRTDTNHLVREGLRMIGAVQHLALFERGTTAVEALGAESLRLFLAGEYFGDSPQRDDLNTIDELFGRVSEVEDLVALNAAWLKNLPGLCALPTDDLQAAVRLRADALPDREQRIARARVCEPRYMKLIRACCLGARHELSRITGASHLDTDQRVMAWLFLTDRGHHYMVDADGWATMFDGTTRAVVCRVEAHD